MPVKYMNCDVCGKYTPFGQRSRIMWQEDCEKLDYWRNRKFLNTNRILHVCRECADKMWEDAKCGS